MTIDSASQGDTHLGRDRGRETLGDRGRARMAWFSPGGIGRMLLALAMAGVTVGASPALGMSTGPATEAIRDTISQVIRLLEDPNLKGPGKAGERRRLLERTIGNRFSYAEMAKRSLGAHWRGLTAAEQEEFVALFQRLLSKTYAHTIEGYAGEQVQYLGERIAEEIAEVRTKIVSDKVEVPVDYRLLRMEGDWRVYDVVVDGVSLVRNYRGQFARILRSSSYADLVEQLRRKVEADQQAREAPRPGGE